MVLESAGRPREWPVASPRAVTSLVARELIQSLVAHHLFFRPQPKPELIFSSAFYRCIQTSVPLAQALGQTLKLEHGLGEWYSPTPANTAALHPRPGSASALAPLFPEGVLDLTYEPTYYPSRKGETLQDLHDRAEIFLAAFLARVEAEHPDVRTVMLFGHAASVIALGRALTGNKELEVVAGCASVTMYGRKAGAAGGGIGGWDVRRMGMVDHLENGVERNWSVRFPRLFLQLGSVLTQTPSPDPPPSSPTSSSMPRARLSPTRESLERRPSATSRAVWRPGWSASCPLLSGSTSRSSQAHSRWTAGPAGKARLQRRAPILSPHLNSPLLYS
jgi:broad specificity phosphatase PhoE